MTDTQTRSVLPFEGFLALLRAKGYAVGLHEHLALAQLLRRWEGTSSPEFGDALAALLGRNDEDVATIRRTFDEVYRPPSPPPTPESAAAVDRWEFVRPRVWALATAAALLVLAIAMWRSVAPQPVPIQPRAESRDPRTERPSGEPSTAPTTPAPSIARPVDAPPPPAPELPPPPRSTEQGIILPVGVGMFLVALAGFWALKARRVQHEWVRDAWSSALAALPGPFHVPLVLRDPVARLPRIDVEDAATILGRAIISETQLRTLDVRRTVRQTVRNGLMPSFAFKPRRQMQPILVLQDISEDMRVWRSKVDLFLTDLRRQGVPLERHYFDADVRRVSDTPRGATTDLDRVLRRRPTAPVLIVSSGVGLSAAMEAPIDGAGLWLRTLRARERRTWLTPVSDTRLWPAELDQIPVNVWPMTRRGLAQAARDLAGVDARPADHERVRVLAEGRATLDGIERVKRLASLVPSPTTELIELLRRRFAPDVPDAVILHLLQDAGRLAAPVIRLSDEELQRCLAAVRFETPRLEAQVRRLLLGILSESEPLANSAAHMRWEIANAVHRVALADLGDGDRAQAVATLEELGRGPMWEEVQAMARLTPATPALGREPGTTLGGQASGHAAPDVRRREGPPADPPPHSLWQGRVPWTWPGVRELVPASVSALLLLMMGWLVGAFPVRALEHVPDAYQLDYAEGPAPSTGSAPLGGTLQLQRGPNATDTTPRMVTLYQNGAVYRADVDVAAGPVTITVGSADIGKHYQARAELVEGNLAISRSVWVPDERVVVVIDASPWARVTFQGEGVPQGAQTTPFSAALKPGTYRLQFENDGLTPAMEQPITVRAPGGEGLGVPERTYRFTMPGFDPSRTAAELAGRPVSQPAQAR